VRGDHRVEKSCNECRSTHGEGKPNQLYFFESAKDSLGMVISSSSRPYGRTWLRFCFSLLQHSCCAVSTSLL